MMKYLKSFNESSDLDCLSLRKDLEYQADVFLAPLKDDGFNYEILNMFDHGNEFTIRLYKEGSSHSELFDYKQVMDRFIPFVVILNKNYDIKDEVYFYSPEEWDVNKKAFTIEQICNDVAPNFLVSIIRLTIIKKKDILLESSSNTDEDERNDLKEFSQGYLAYLVDDGWRISVPLETVQTRINSMLSNGFGKPNMMVLLLPPISYYGGIFKFYEIKDDFIPFLHMLAREYNLYSRDHDGLSIVFGMSTKWTGDKQILSYDDILKGNYNRTSDLNYIAIMVKDKI